MCSVTGVMVAHYDELLEELGLFHKIRHAGNQSIERLWEALHLLRRRQGLVG